MELGTFVKVATAALSSATCVYLCKRFIRGRVSSPVVVVEVVEEAEADSVDNQPIDEVVHVQPGNELSNPNQQQEAGGLLARGKRFFIWMRGTNRRFKFDTFSLCIGLYILCRDGELLDYYFIVDFYIRLTWDTVTEFEHNFGV